MVKWKNQTIKDGSIGQVELDGILRTGKIRFKDVSPFDHPGALTDIIFYFDNISHPNETWWLARFNVQNEIVNHDSVLNTLTILKSKTPVVKAKKIRRSQLKFSTDKETAIKQAIESMKTGSYKATAIKVELEAELSRDEDEHDHDYCEDFLLEHVSKDTKKHTIFYKFYYDGSVDSEFTVTVDINHPECIIEYINAFNALAEEIGNGADTSGAGMHIAILNSENGNYPGGNSLNAECNNNFRTAVTPLLPALFFLGSCDYRSRELGYRMPRVSRDKYSAVHAEGCYEFRVFETCYNYPDRFYDYLVTIANCLQFYSPEQVLPSFTGTIGTLGMPDDGDGVGRFYFTYEHVKALEKGLEIIKPSYKSIDTLKKERNLKIDSAKLKTIDQSLELSWRNEYSEYRKNQKDKREKFLNELKESYEEDLTHTIDKYESYIFELTHHQNMSSVGVLNWFSNNFDQSYIPIVKFLLDNDTEVAKTCYRELYPFEQYKQDRLRNAPKPPERGVRQYIKNKKAYHLTRGLITVTI